MASDRHALIPALVIAWLGGGCAPPDALRFRLVQGLDDDPFVVGTTLALGLEGSDAQVAFEETFPLGAPELELGPLPHGGPLRLRAEVRSEAVVLARGYSFPFTHLPEAPAAFAPHVLVGSLGRFTRTTVEQPDSPALAIAPAPDGARLVTSAGTVYAYRVHGPDGDPVLEVLGRAPPHRITGVWAPVGRSGFLAVGGSSRGASFVDADTAESLEAPSLLVEHGADPLLVGFDDGVLVVGGLTAAGPSAAVTWVERRADGLVAAAREPLSEPLARGHAIAASVEVAGEARPVALVLASTGAAWVVDPTGERGATRSEPVLDHLESAGVAALGPGLVLVAGGRDASGPSAAIDLLILRDERVAVLAPRPRALAVPRLHPTAVPFGLGRALVVGGRDGLELPHDTSELFEVRVDDLPGDAVPTGRVPVAAADPRGVALDDGSVLVVDRALLAHYFSPRSP